MSSGCCSDKKCCPSVVFYHIALILVVLSGINYGLIGLFNADLMQILFGNSPVLEKSIYTLIGICSVALLIFSMKKCSCKNGNCGDKKDGCCKKGDKNEKNE